MGKSQVGNSKSTHATYEVIKQLMTCAICSHMTITEWKNSVNNLHLSKHWKWKVWEQAVIAYLFVSGTINALLPSQSSPLPLIIAQLCLCSALLANRYRLSLMQSFVLISNWIQVVSGFRLTAQSIWKL